MNGETDRLNDSQQSKVIDLCRTNMVKHIKCDTPSSEGYEVTNLTSTNFLSRSKGFLAERFIKPPINVTLDFASNVHIRYIVIHCKVGAQKTMGLEIFSETQRTEGLLESIGSGVLPDDKIGFVFHRHNETVTSSLGGQYLYKTFKSWRHLSFAGRLKIKIFRTSGSSVPAIGKVEIWANPCKLPQTTNRSVDKPHQILRSPKDINCQKVAISLPVPPQVQLRVFNQLPSIEKESQQIPDDFLDPITCEIMSQPLIMPSGKIIDNSTLESYIKAEEKWGRGANDPFTGVLFTASRKPLVASELKIRIDKYLSKNSDNVELFGIPRTVGRRCIGSSDESKPSISSLVSNSHNSSPLLFNLLTENRSIMINKSLGENQPTAKRQKLEIGIAESFSEGSRNKLSNTTSRGENIKTNSYQERMDRSLEFSLKQTLAQLPKLTAVKKCSTSKELTLGCQICNSRIDLFSIPCKHFICRNCLISLKTRAVGVCQVCKSDFKSCDVVKIHLPKV